MPSVHQYKRAISWVRERKVWHVYSFLISFDVGALWSDRGKMKKFILTVHKIALLLWSPTVFSADLTLWNCVQSLHRRPWLFRRTLWPPHCRDPRHISRHSPQPSRHIWLHPFAVFFWMWYTSCIFVLFCDLSCQFPSNRKVSWWIFYIWLYIYLCVWSMYNCTYFNF